VSHQTEADLPLILQAEGLKGVRLGGRIVVLGLLEDVESVFIFFFGVGHGRRRVGGFLFPD